MPAAEACGLGSTPATNITIMINVIKKAVIRFLFISVFASLFLWQLPNGTSRPPPGRLPACCIPPPRHPGRHFFAVKSLQFVTNWLQSITNRLQLQPLKANLAGKRQVLQKNSRDIAQKKSHFSKSDDTISSVCMPREPFTSTASPGRRAPRRNADASAFDEKLRHESEGCSPHAPSAIQRARSPTVTSSDTPARAARRPTSSWASRSTLPSSSMSASTATRRPGKPASTSRLLNAASGLAL